MNEHSKYLPTTRACKEYTLFVDRDGVLNQPIIDDYARKPEDLLLVPGIIETLNVAKMLFKHVILVTNQQGVGRGLMSDIDLENVHLKMYDNFKSLGVPWFDAVFYAPYLTTENHTWRKPNNGMLLKTKSYFPAIKWEKSIMVGDSPSDMKLADSCNVTKVRIENPQFNFDNQDVCFKTFTDFIAQFYINS